MLNNVAALLSGTGAAPAAANSYESIATATVGAGGQTTISFTSIPSTYKHLQLRWIGRNTSTTNSIIKINFDTADTSYWHLLYGDGSAAASTATSAASPVIGNQPLSNVAANIFGAGVLDILDYQNTNKYKTLRSLAGYDTSGGGYMLMYSGLWKSTSAITTITIASGANDFAQYSSFALYGIKG